MSRTPFIAGNWKMNKTIAEAEAFIAALLPQVYDTEGVEALMSASDAGNGRAEGAGTKRAEAHRG